jgi:hypothetical protein
MKRRRASLGREMPARPDWFGLEDGVLTCKPASFIIYAIPPKVYWTLVRWTLVPIGPVCAGHAKRLAERMAKGLAVEVSDA